MRPDQSAPKPDALDFDRAAAVPLAASTALQALRDVARLESGMRAFSPSVTESVPRAEGCCKCHCSLA